MAFKKLKLWFDADLAKLLAKKIKEVYPDFNSSNFYKEVTNKIDSLELKDRVEVFADAFHNTINKEFTETIPILINILGAESQEETGMFKKYYWIMPIAKYVEKYGVNDFDVSIKAIEEITKRNTGEYTIRPFLDKYPKATLQQMLVWSKSKNKHVRRLSSEGVIPNIF